MPSPLRCASEKSCSSGSLLCRCYTEAEVGFHRLDMFVANLIVVELKTSKHLADIDFIVVRSYLRAVNREHGLLLNFAVPTLEAKRVYVGS
jgi:GxxExxY protein